MSERDGTAEKLMAIKNDDFDIKMRKNPFAPVSLFPEASIRKKEENAALINFAKGSPYSRVSSKRRGFN